MASAARGPERQRQHPAKVNGLRFRISTWNCFGMGQGLSAVMALRAPFGARLRDADVIAECGSPDVLCLQELLSRDAQQFFDGVGQGHFISRFRDDNRLRFGRSVTMRGCGLGIGSRSALTKTSVRTFPGARGGWDRLARKGCLYAQLAFAEGVTVDVVTAHLQAGYDARAIRIREAQLADLKLLLASVGSPDRPFIVCGDFNIDGLAPTRGDAPYKSLAAALRGFQDLGATDDLSTFDPHPQGNGLAYALEPRAATQRIDYIFWRPARGPIDLRCTSTERFFDKPLGQTTLPGITAGWASDHYGLSATFEVDRGSSR
jgi:endonuclease/exonuclease/phosphatase family metal-dependent hydrolase